LGKLAGYLEESLLDLDDAVMGEALAEAAAPAKAPRKRVPSRAAPPVSSKPRTPAPRPKRVLSKSGRAAKPAKPVRP
ncbi:MAG TPA: hypothetical protein VF319_11645, partial [Caldimonas sp.]